MFQKAAMPIPPPVPCCVVNVTSVAFTCPPPAIARIEPLFDEIDTDSEILLNGAATLKVAGALAVTVPTLTPMFPDSDTLAPGQELEKLQTDAVALIEVALSGVVTEVDDRLMLVLLRVRTALAVTLAASLTVELMVPLVAFNPTLPVVVMVLVEILVPERLTPASPA